MRSNPAWSWAWFKENLSSKSKVLKDLSQEVGVVGGDIKPDNVDLIITSEKKLRIGIIDLDDGGRGAFLGDIFHTLSYNQVWPIKLNTIEALDLYTAGLNGVKIEKMKLQDFELKKSDSDGASAYSKKKLEKMKDSKEEFLKELKLTSIQDGPEGVQTMFKEIHNEIEKEASNIGKIIWKGLRLKQSGGSTNVPRFTYLIEDKKGLKVIEFKYQAISAVAAAGQKQPPHIERLNSLVDLYRPDGDLGVIVKFLETKEGVFIVRERRSPVFDSSSESNQKDISSYTDYVGHMFWWLGRVHGKQSDTYVQSWNNNKDLIYKDLMDMVDDHVSESKHIFEN